MTTEATVVFVTVVALRFLVPLLIPKFPLPAILACLVIDGIDQTIFQCRDVGENCRTVGNGSCTRRWRWRVHAK